MDIHEAGYDPEAHREPDPATYKRQKENPSLIQLGESCSAVVQEGSCHGTVDDCSYYLSLHQAVTNV